MSRRLTAVAAAACLALSNAYAISQYGPPPVVYQVGVPVTDQIPTQTVFNNTGTQVTLNAPTTETVGWFGLFTSGRDMGDWFCSYCSTDPGTGGANLDPNWADFISTFVNNAIGGPIGAWRLGDTIALCNGGGSCVILTYVGYATDAWRPNPKNAMTKKDNGKYKNKVGVSFNNLPPNVAMTPMFNINGAISAWLLSGSGGYGYTITVGPLEEVPPPQVPQVPPPGTGGTFDPGNFGGNGSGTFPGFDFSGGTGWGDGGGCVHVDSQLPDGRRAGDIKVGDMMVLGDEYTEELTSLIGQVTFSVRKSMPGWRITTSDGISLICSETAPIWTDEGYVLAPSLLGKRVATRLDDSDGSKTAFKVVEQLEAVGMIEVQHITVGNRAFWAGETRGAYILHHNLKVDDTP